MDLNQEKMTCQEIKYTKVIAEFMGYKYSSDKELFGVLVSPDGFPYLPDMLEFHVNYNKLMEVWQKLRDLKMNSTKAEMIHSIHKGKIAHAILNFTQKEAFNKLAEAIVWYNENKK